MGFVAPAALLIGLGILAAIVATYLLRPRRPAKRVSSTFLWLAALNDVQAARPWRRVPPSVLLLLQLLAAGAIALALARPYVLTTDAGGPYTIVLLDSSASMQATDVAPTRFDVAKRRIAQLIDQLEAGQQLGIVSLDAAPHVIAPPTSDRATLHAALDTAQPTARAANLPVALSVAGTLTEGRADAQIAIVGDGSLDRSQIPTNFPTPIRIFGVGSGTPENLAVAGLGTRTVQGHFSALARVVNYGAQPRSASLTLKVDGTRYDARTLTVDPGKSTDAEWDNLPLTARTLEARLDQSDSLDLDNAAWAVMGGDRPTRVLLVSDGNIFVERALGLRPSTQVTRVSPADYTTQVQAYDLLVLDGFVPPVLPTGSSVLLLHPPQGNSLIGTGPDLSINGISAGKADDPLLQDVPLNSVHVSRSRRLEPAAWTDSVIQSPETPLLLVGEQAGHRIGVIGFDVHQSDLPLQPGFPVLVQHLLDWLVPTGSTATPVVQVGDSVSLAPLPDATAVDIITPDGKRVQAAPPLPPPPFSGTDQPGIYQVVQRDAAGRATTTYFAANFVNPRESQLKAGADSGAPSVGAYREPLRSPHEFWEGLAVLALVLLGIEAALAWWQFAAVTQRARLAAALRLATAALLVLALVGIAIPQRVDRQAVVFVTDISASVLDSRADATRFVAESLTARHAEDAYAVVAAARGAEVRQGLTRADTPALDSMTNLKTDGTDLAAGLRLAADLLPAGYRSRVVLLSDGQETSGDAVSQARLLRARGIEVDAVPLASARGPEALVDSVSAPATVHVGERFTVGVRLVTNTPTEGTLHVTVNGQPLADQAVSLTTGTTDLVFSGQAAEAGLLDVRAKLDAVLDTNPQNNESRSLIEVQGPPRVLVVEQRDGEGATIAAALNSTGMRVESRGVADMPDQVDTLGAYSAVVLADVSAERLSDAQQTTLRAYVRDLGRGLLAIGGDSSFGQGDYVGTPLDDALPVRSSVRSHRDQGRIALLLVIDQSGSMSDDIYSEGTTKLDMAKQAALLSAEQLGPRDLVGVMTFESFRHWILPMTPMLGLGPTAIEDRLAPLTADGGTDIFPAVAQAFDAIKETDARYKHIILLTDGMSCCGGDYPGLLDRMRGANVTLSTIAIGGDADQQLLLQLARQGDGRYYFAEHARDIPRLMTRETELATRGPVVEGAIAPRQVAPDAALSAVAAGGLPQLGGYLVTTPKDLAEVLLVSDAADPLLARWQYGLGRAAAWTSDLRGRWSEGWLQWPGTAQLFSQLVGWTIAPTRGPLQLHVRADAETGHISVDETEPGASSTAVVHAHVAGPGGANVETELSATGPGHYEASFPLGGPGAYIVRVEAERDGAVTGAAEAGLPVAYPAEFRQVTADPRRLEQIARAGGGHVLQTPAAAFADDLAPVTTPLPLQAALLLLAALLLVLDVGLRRLRVSVGDLWDWLRHPRRVELEIPWRATEGWQPAAWMPGAWAARRPPPRVLQPLRRETSYGGHVTPGLARSAVDEAEAEDALSATTRWLAARRGTTGDKG